MKYLRKFNESIEEQIYQQVLDSIKDCFQEFEDNGWYWFQGSPVDSHLSYHPMPHFKYIMKKRGSDESDVDDDYRKFEFTGKINSNGDISWKEKKTTWAVNFSSDDYQDFIVAIKRLQEETGLDFEFSYNNEVGYKRIIIQGRI
jgi:hypothetical protein